jgi:ethylmalonyl-CoA mutase
VHLVGLSILSGSHRPLVADVLARLRAEGLGEVPVVVGGIIPPADAAALETLGVARVFTPRDYAPAAIFAEILSLLEARLAHAA